MANQLDDASRNAMIATIETTWGTSPLFRMYTGSAPANVAAAATGTQLCNLALPSDFVTAGSAGQIVKNGTWSGTGSAAGNAGYARIYSSDGTTCRWQGTVTATGGGGDVTLDNINIAVSQAITVNTWTLTVGGA